MYEYYDDFKKRKGKYFKFGNKSRFLTILYFTQYTNSPLKENEIKNILLILKIVNSLPQGQI